MVNNRRDTHIQYIQTDGYGAATLSECVSVVVTVAQVCHHSQRHLITQCRILGLSSKVRLLFGNVAFVFSSVLLLHVLIFALCATFSMLFVVIDGTIKVRKSLYDFK